MMQSVQLDSQNRGGAIQKRQRAGAVQDASRCSKPSIARQHPGVRQPSAAFNALLQPAARTLTALVLFGLAAQPAFACAVCYGEPDAPMSHGLTWAIVALCSVVGVVLSGVVVFFVHIGRRSSQMARRKDLSELLDQLD